MLKNTICGYVQIPSTCDDCLIPLPRLTCGSIMVIVEGKGRIENLSEKSTINKELSVTRGDVIYIAPDTQVCFTQCSANISAYRTFSYEKGPDHSARNTIPTEASTKIKVTSYLLFVKHTFFN